MKTIRILLNKYESSPTIIVEDETDEIIDLKTLWGLTHSNGVPQLKLLFEELGFNVIIDDSEKTAD